MISIDPGIRGDINCPRYREKLITASAKMVSFARTSFVTESIINGINIPIDRPVKKIAAPMNIKFDEKLRIENPRRNKRNATSAVLSLNKAASLWKYMPVIKEIAVNKPINHPVVADVPSSSANMKKSRWVGILKKIIIMRKVKRAHFNKPFFVFVARAISYSSASASLRSDCLGRKNRTSRREMNAMP